MPAAARNCSAKAYTDEAVAWQSGGCYRGTWAIISTCLTTIIACTWTIQRLNIPAKRDRAGKRLRRKLKWMVITALFPEAVLIHAALEFRMAWTALKAMHENSKLVKWPWWYGNPLKRLRRKISEKLEKNDEEAGEKMRNGSNAWTIVHCYYANMGGFLYVNGGKKFRLTAAELAESQLAQHQRPEIAKEDIQDKSKQDWLAKTLAGLQISQLILSIITRHIQHLRFSQLEMVTLSFAICGVAIYITSIHKPQGVDRATELGAANPEVSPSPLQTYDGLWPRLLSRNNHGANDKRDAPRIPNDNISFDNGKHVVNPVVYLVVLASGVFGVIHAIAWSFEFPTPGERLIWRIATCISAASPVLGLLAIPLVQLTTPAGAPELFVGKCLKLLQEYRWHCPGEYPVREAIANLERVLKGFLRLDTVYNPEEEYSQIFMLKTQEARLFMPDLLDFLRLRGPYEGLYTRRRGWRENKEEKDHGLGTKPLDLHSDKQFIRDFSLLVKAIHSVAGSKLKEEAKVGGWPRRTVLPTVLKHLILYGMSILYCISRLLLLGIAFSSIRKMPGTVYIETDWTVYMLSMGSKG